MAALSRNHAPSIGNRLRRSDLFRLSACARCGECLASCPVYEQTGDEKITARWKIREAQHLIWSQLGILSKIRGPKNLSDEELRAAFERLAACTGCAACAAHCPSNIATDELWIGLRAWLHDRGVGVEGPGGIALDSVQDPGKSNPFGQPRGERGEWIPKNLREPRASENLYFVGCLTSFSANRLARSVVKSLESADGFDFSMLGTEEYCCGDPLARIGYVDEARKLQEANVAEFRRRAVKRVFTGCAGCFKNLKRFCPPDIRVQHVVELYAELIREGRLALAKEMRKKVAYFDGCDLGRHAGVYEPPREVLRTIPGIEAADFPRNREEGMCCGGPLMSADPEMAKRIAQARVKEAMDLGVEVIVTSCPACMINLRSGAQEMGPNVTVQDLPLLLPSLLGRPRARPTPAVQESPDQKDQQI